MATFSSIAITGLTVGMLSASAYGSIQAYGLYSVKDGSRPAVANLGGTDFTVDVSNTDVHGAPLQPGQAMFVFHNSASGGSITDIYFTNGPINDIASIAGSPGTSFSQYAKPPALPGGELIGFNSSATLSAQANSPVPVDGVNPGGWLAITADLKPDVQYSDVLHSLSLPPDKQGSLGIGIRVQAMAGEKGDSLATGNFAAVADALVVSEPAAVVTWSLLGLLLSGGAVVWRRRR